MILAKNWLPVWIVTLAYMGAKPANLLPILDTARRVLLFTRRIAPHSLAASFHTKSDANRTPDGRRWINLTNSYVPGRNITTLIV